MLYKNSSYGVRIAFLPVGNGKFEPEEPRFIPTDIDFLKCMGWIALERYASGGDPILQITRTGSKAAKLLQSA